MKFQGQLMYHIMLHLDKESLEEGVLNFTINDHAADFGPVEHFMVTGLPWGEMGELPTTSEVHHKVFQSKRDLRLFELEKTFADTYKQDNGSGELSLKLAYLVCVYGMLLSKDRKGKKLDIQSLHLIDDLRRFTSYPWGRISYEYLVHSVHTACNNMVGLKKKSTARLAFDVNGFTYALQAWAFEVFPSVGNYYGAHVEENINLLPRILCWSALTFFQFRDLSRFFQTGVEFKLVPLKLKVEDTKALEDASVPIYPEVRITGSYVESLPPKKRNQKRRIEEKNTSDSKFNCKRLHTLHSACTYSTAESDETRSTLPADIDKSEGMQDILRRVKRNEGLFLGLYTHFNIPLPSEVKEALDGDAHTQESDSPRPVAKEHESVVENCMKSTDIDTAKGDKLNLKHVENASAKKPSSMANTNVHKGLTNEGNEVSHIYHEVGALQMDNYIDGCMEEDTFDIAYHEPEGSFNPLLNEANVHAAQEQKTSEVGEAEIEVLSSAMKEQKPSEQGETEIEVLSSAVKVQKTSEVEEVEIEELSSAMKEQNTSEVKRADIEVLSSTVKEHKNAGETDVNCHELPILKIFKRKLKPEKSILSPYTDPTVRRKKKKHLQIKVTDNAKECIPISAYNPNVLQTVDVIEKFKKWYNKPRKSKSREEVVLPLFCLDKTHSEWFKPIYSRMGKLSNEHIDVLLNILIIKSSITPESFLHRWTIIESYGSQKLLISDYGSCSSVLRMYSAGTLPKQRGKAWHDVDKIYGVAHVLDQHWVAYQLDLEAESITVYDSLSDNDSWVEVSNHFNHVCYNIPRLCKETNIYGKKAGKSELKEVWDLIKFEHPPQQGNCFDCGIMVVKFIESLAAGFPVTKIDSKKIPKFRDSYCADVFSLGNVQECTSSDSDQ